MNRRRNKGESLKDLAADIARLISLAYEGQRSEHRDQ